MDTARTIGEAMAAIMLAVLSIVVMAQHEDARIARKDKEVCMDTLDTKWGAAWRSPQAQGGGYPPDGEHDVTVTRVVVSEITSRGEVCDPTFVFFLQAQSGCAFKTYQTIKSEKALWRMRGILERLGLPIPESPGRIIDSLRTLEGRCVHVRVRSRDYQGRTMHDVDFLSVVTQIQSPSQPPQAWPQQPQPQAWTQPQAPQAWPQPQAPQAWTPAPPAPPAQTWTPAQTAMQPPQAWPQPAQPQAWTPAPPAAQPQPAAQPRPQPTPAAQAQAQLDAVFPPQSPAPAPAPQPQPQPQPITNATQSPANPADVMGSDGWQTVPESAIPF